MLKLLNSLFQDSVPLHQIGCLSRVRDDKFIFLNVLALDVLCELLIVESQLVNLVLQIFPCSLDVLQLLFQLPDHGSQLLDYRFWLLDHYFHLLDNCFHVLDLCFQLLNLLDISLGLLFLALARMQPIAVRLAINPT